MHTKSIKTSHIMRFAAILAVVMALFASVLGQPARAAGETVSIWVTTPDQTKLLQQQAGLSFAPDSGSNPVTIDINEGTVYQQIDGFGASLTDSSASLICGKLTTAQRDTLLNNLFNRNTGIGLSFLRQPMGASDFSSIGNYSYDDMLAGQSDPNLTGFNISHDLQCIIPLLKQIKQINPALKLMANPWSPPGWMKTSGSMIGGNLQTQYRTAWANYFVKFIQAYAAQGLPIDYISMQNEPLFIPPGYPGMGMSAGEQATLLATYMGPAFAQAGISSKILVWDHNWTNQYPYDVLANATARSYAAGTAFHWYGGSVTSQTDLHNTYPDKGIWFTEGSGFTNTGFAQYLKDIDQLLIIANMRNWGKATVRWNLVLDQNQGPLNGGCNNCTATVTINNSTGAVTYNAEYYALGHASKFVVPGAFRIDSNNFAGGIENVAFKNPDGSIVVVAFNAGASSATFKLRWGAQSFSYTLPAGAVATFKWNAGITVTPGPTFTPTRTATQGAGSANLALNKPVTCSPAPQFPCAEAVDGNLGTRWSSAASDPQWLQVDLGSTQNISGVVLNWEAAYGSAYQIQVSNSATGPWTNIFSTTTGNGATDDLTGLSGSGRYIRMNGTARGTQWGYSLWEFQVYGPGGLVSTPTPTRTNTPGPGPTNTPTNTVGASPTRTATPGNSACSTTNIALNKPATSSSNESAGTTPNLAVDGNLTSTRWSSTFSDPQWIQVDLGATQNICRVVLNWEAAYGTAYQIQVSNSATGPWANIYSTTTGNGATDDLTGLSGSGRYIRMNGTTRATGYGYSLWEFSIYP
jgi:glucosylceramidase